jgi:hypothetical protein
MSRDDRNLYSQMVEWVFLCCCQALRTVEKPADVSVGVFLNPCSADMAVGSLASQETSSYARVDIQRIEPVV